MSEARTGVRKRDVEKHESNDMEAKQAEPRESGSFVNRSGDLFSFVYVPLPLPSRDQLLQLYHERSTEAQLS